MRNAVIDKDYLFILKSSLVNRIEPHWIINKKNKELIYILIGPDLLDLTF